VSAAGQALSATQEQYADALSALREACDHPLLLEGRAYGDTFGRNVDLRICGDCGTEEENRDGFRVLTGSVRPAKRAEIYAARRGPRHVLAWCHGDPAHSGHPVPPAALLYDRRTRCGFTRTQARSAATTTS
jgi:hypothetical protein